MSTSEHKNYPNFTKNKCFSFDIPRKIVTFKKIACEHCGKLSSVGNYIRWHGKNCVVINPTKHEKISII